MTLTPIEIIFYDESDAEKERFTRNRIPAYILDMAIDLEESLQALTKTGEDVTAPLTTSAKTAPLFDFIVELFGNKFTRDELKQKSDLGDCFNVYRSVLARANNLAMDVSKANPPVPSSRKK